MFYVDKPDQFVKDIVSKCFPDYRGKKIKISTSVPKVISSYWSGGSRDFYCFYELSTGKALGVETNHPAFQTSNPRDLEALPNGIVLVKHSICCGKDFGITIYVNSQDCVPLLSEKKEITEDETIVLKFTRSYKSSYAGISDYRFHEANNHCGITKERWDNAKGSLIEKKLLNKNGAISAEGRNAIS